MDFDKFFTDILKKSCDNKNATLLPAMIFEDDSSSPPITKAYAAENEDYKNNYVSTLLGAFELGAHLIVCFRSTSAGKEELVGGKVVVDLLQRNRHPLLPLKSDKSLEIFGHIKSDESNELLDRTQVANLLTKLQKMPKSIEYLKSKFEGDIIKPVGDYTSWSDITKVLTINDGNIEECDTSTPVFIVDPAGTIAEHNTAGTASGDIYTKFFTTDTDKIFKTQPPDAADVKLLKDFVRQEIENNFKKVDMNLSDPIMNYYSSDALPTPIIIENKKSNSSNVTILHCFGPNFNKSSSGDSDYVLKYLGILERMYDAIHTIVKDAATAAAAGGTHPKLCILPISGGAFAVDKYKQSIYEIFRNSLFNFDKTVIDNTTVYLKDDPHNVFQDVVSTKSSSAGTKNDGVSSSGGASSSLGAFGKYDTYAYFGEGGSSVSISDYGSLPNLFEWDASSSTYRLLHK